MAKEDKNKTSVTAITMSTHNAFIFGYYTFKVKKNDFVGKQSKEIHKYLCI